MVKNQCQLNFRMSNQEIKVPNIGDFENVEVIEVLVSEGQSISKNDPLITIESDKSSVEIPASYEGLVKSINIKVGDKVSEGDLILILENTSKIKENVKEKPQTEKEFKKIKVIKPEIEQILKNNNSVTDILPASPKVRKFARELGVDINQVEGSEKGGRVIEDDVKRYVSSKPKNNNETKQNKQDKIKNEFKHSDFGETEIKDIPRVKKLASNYLVNSWNTIPHVTNHDEVDVTEMENFRSSLTDIYTGEKIKITPLAFIIKALVASL